MKHLFVVLFLFLLFPVVAVASPPENSRNFRLWSLKKALLPNRQVQIIDVPIAIGTDDATERLGKGGVVDLVNTKLKLRDGVAGLRFAGLTIPNNATVQIAYVTFTARKTHTKPASFNISTENIGNAVTFNPLLFDLSNRVLSPTPINWLPPVWTLDLPYQTPDLSPLVQGIVSRPDWVSGNAINFIINIIGKREAYSFEGGLGTQIPTLHVEYTIPTMPPGGGGGNIIGGIYPPVYTFTLSTGNEFWLTRSATFGDVLSGAGSLILAAVVVFIFVARLASGRPA